MPQWAKIYRRIGENAVLAEMAEANPLAALLFTWSIAAANVYGILPADPRGYRARVAPAMMVSAEHINEAISAQKKAGLVIDYEGLNGAGETTHLLHICNYNRYQDINWFRIRASEYTLPDNWYVPEALETAIENGTLEKANKKWGSYGVEARAQPMLPSKGTPAKAKEPVLPSKGGGADTPDTPDTPDINDDSKAAPRKPLRTASPEEPPEEKKPETDQQLAIRAAWDSHKLGDLPSRPKGYSGLTKLVAQHGVPLVSDWTRYVQRNRPTVPDGANPWDWFCTCFRDAMKRPWEWQEDRIRGSPEYGMSPPGDHSNVKRNPDGTVKW